MALKIYLIRHGETDFNKTDKEWGQDNDIPLNDWGELQSKKLAERLKDIKFDKLFSSDLKRAKQTAEELSKSLNVNVIFDKRLREYNPGEVDPASEEWTEKYKKMLESGMSKYDIRPFGGENIWDLIKRTESFLKDIEKEEGTIAVVSHSGVNAAIINLSQGRNKDEFLGIKQDNVCINLLEFNEGKWGIKLINDSSHISEIKPEIKKYENQDEIKQIAKEYLFNQLKDLVDELYISGDIINGNFSMYNRPFKRYKGSVVEAYAVLKKGINPLNKWKVSLLIANLQKYEIGKIKVNENKHKVNLNIIQTYNEIRGNEKERLI